MTCNNHSFDAGRCPLCGQPNECQLCTAAAWRGPCWCAKLEIPDTLLAQVPVELRNRACICYHCIESSRLNQAGKANVVFCNGHASLEKFIPRSIDPKL
jgi:hypothetical protein